MTPSRSPVLKTRELDQLIAEKVFGAMWHDMGDGVELLQPPGSMNCWAMRRDGELKSSPLLPEFQSHIASAFLVVEQMRERGFIYEVSEVPGVPRTRQHHASFTELGRWYGHDDIHTDLEPDGQAVAETPARAICEAAIKALGFDPPEGVQR